jgi:hypothetical protein
MGQKWIVEEQDDEGVLVTVQGQSTALNSLELGIGNETRTGPFVRFNAMDIKIYTELDAAAHATTQYIWVHHFLIENTAVNVPVEDFTDIFWGRNPWTYAIRYDLRNDVKILKTWRYQLGHPYNSGHSASHGLQDYIKLSLDSYYIEEQDEPYTGELYLYSVVTPQATWFPVDLAGCHMYRTIVLYFNDIII